MNSFPHAGDGRKRPPIAGRALGWWRRLWSGWRRWPIRPPRQLRLCESLALGDRRFLLVVECAQQKFLLGSSGSTIALLAELKAGAADAGTAPMSGIFLAPAKDAAE